jgi:hypothetical protein
MPFCHFISLLGISQIETLVCIKNVYYNAAIEDIILSDKIIIHINPEIKDLVPVYISNRKKDVANMKEFLKQNRLIEIKTLGHNMKGGGKLYGMDIVTILGGKIEEAAIVNDKSVIEETLRVLEDYFERVEVE